MSNLALVSVVVGLVIIAARAPLAVAPSASSRNIRWMIETDARIRVAGGFFGGIGLAMILAASSSDHDAAWAILLGGWAWVAAGLVLVGNPPFYRDLGQRLLQNSWRMRAMGTIGALFGSFVLYLGIGVY